MVNREQLVSGWGILRHFINGSLDLSRENNHISGFELSRPLLNAAAYNTYIETVSNKADILYLRAKENLTEMTTYSYLNHIKRLSDKFIWKDKKVMLAFDYTDEDFYGEVQGFDIHGWTKKEAVTGKFKFLTCSIVSDEIPQKIPLISVPIKLGHYKSSVIIHCLHLIKNYIGEIELILFDRGFYDKDLMYELVKLDNPFLIFVPKHKDKKEILYQLDKEEHIAIIWDYELKKNKTKDNFQAYLTFLRQIYDKKNGNEYDWVFVTNVEEVALSKIIATYKKRWRVENQFKTQDEAMIKCKSKEMKIRYFFFMFQQMLQTQWVCFHKEEISFKRFIIEMQKVCQSLVENPKRPYSKRQKMLV